MTRSFTFEATPAVRAARERLLFVDCPVCASNVSRYLFHKRGVRFVRCLSCGLVYVNPTGGDGANYFDRRLAPMRTRATEAPTSDDIWDCHPNGRVVRSSRRAPKRIVMIGRYLPELRESPALRDLGVDFIEHPMPSSANFDRRAMRRGFSLPSAVPKTSSS